MAASLTQEQREEITKKIIAYLQLHPGTSARQIKSEMQLPISHVTIQNIINKNNNNNNIENDSKLDEERIIELAKMYISTPMTVKQLSKKTGIGYWKLYRALVNKLKTLDEKLYVLVTNKMENNRNANISHRVNNQNFTGFTVESSIDIIAEEIAKNRNEINNQGTDERITFLYDTMIQRGFFDTSDFIRTMHDAFGLDAPKMDNILLYGRTKLKEQHKQLWDEYSKKIQRNKIRYYILHQRQIRNMLIGIKNQKYDIVDYYIDFSMPTHVFIRLYRDLTEMNIIQWGERATFNTFFKKYDALDSNDSYNFSSDNIDMINGELISQNDRDIVNGIMQIYNIPRCYFKLCFSKYKKGEFDSLIKKAKSR